MRSCRFASPAPQTAAQCPLMWRGLLTSAERCMFSLEKHSVKPDSLFLCFMDLFLLFRKRGNITQSHRPPRHLIFKKTNWSWAWRYTPVISALREDCKSKPSLDNLVIQQDYVSKSKGLGGNSVWMPWVLSPVCKKTKTKTKLNRMDSAGFTSVGSSAGPEGGTHTLYELWT